MKYKLDDLYFAKCRHCVMDIVNVTDENGFIMTPHPDYWDYYTILLQKGDRYVSIYDRNLGFTDMSRIDNPKEHYGEDLIIEMFRLTEYVELRKKRISRKECDLVDSTIQKTRKLVPEYGYKKI